MGSRAVVEGALPHTQRLALPARRATTRASLRRWPRSTRSSTGASSGVCGGGGGAERVHGERLVSASQQGCLQISLPNTLQRHHPPHPTPPAAASPAAPPSSLTTFTSCTGEGQWWVRGGGRVLGALISPPDSRPYIHHRPPRPAPLPQLPPAGLPGRQRRRAPDVGREGRPGL